MTWCRRGRSLWARNFDTHGLFTTAAAGDVYSDFYTELYGVMVWVPLSSLPSQPDGHGRHLDYEALLACQPVLDTLRGAFDALSGLL